MTAVEMNTAASLVEGKRAYKGRTGDRAREAPSANSIDAPRMA